VSKTDYTPSSLRAALAGQDAVVCAIALSALAEQKTIIEAAAQAGVKRFIPVCLSAALQPPMLTLGQAEFGCGTAPENASQLVPPLVMKQDVVQCLRSTGKDGMTWTAIRCRMFFDWSIANSHMQFNVPERRYAIFSHGNHPFIGTTLSQTARSIPAVFSSAHFAETANKYIYIPSFAA
jgi:hypothetical protein